MSERQEPYVTATATPIPDYLRGAEVAVLNRQEWEFVRRMREKPDNVPVLVERDIARFLAKYLDRKTQARSRLISPLFIGNYLTNAMGTVNED